MKRTKLIFASVLFLLTAVSCHEDEATKSKDDFEDFDAVGKFHNDGLDFILNKLRENRPAQRTTRDELLARNKEYGLEFIKLKNPELPLNNLRQFRKVRI
jgi:hypothetical protein